MAPQTFTRPALLEDPKIGKSVRILLKMIIFLFPAKFVKKHQICKTLVILIGTMLNVTAKCLMLTFILLNAILHDVILLNVVAPQMFTTPALLEDPLNWQKCLNPFGRRLFFCFPPNLSKNTKFAKKIEIPIRGVASS